MLQGISPPSNYEVCTPISSMAASERHCSLELHCNYEAVLYGIFVNKPVRKNTPVGSLRGMICLSAQVCRSDPPLRHLYWSPRPGDIPPLLVLIMPMSLRVPLRIHNTEWINSASSFFPKDSNKNGSFYNSPAAHDNVDSI